MNALATLFLLGNSLVLLAVPRSWAPLPLLVGTCYMTLGQGIEIGPFSFTVIRILIAVGVLRVMLRGEHLAGKMMALDWIMVAWGAWAVCSSVFHKSPVEALVFRMGAAYNTLGIYFLIRVFCEKPADIVQLIKITALLLVPVALEMIREHATGRNMFSFLGGVPPEVVVRNDRLRAQGPFAHAILAGTVGAVCFPLMIGIWRQHPVPARVGLIACLVMILACNSSGPILAVMVSILGLVLWRWRHLTRQMRIAAVVGYVLLELVMKAPAYYLIARIDLTGGSTGWHRARLIESSIEHLGEWWFAGTDVTRHWMPTGVSWSQDHTDIVNQYLIYGVWGGLPLMALFIAALWTGFAYVGQTLRLATATSQEEQFLIWTLGAALLGQAASCISVSYFDQSFLFLYLNLAAIGSLRSTYVAADHISVEGTAWVHANPTRVRA